MNRPEHRRRPAATDHSAARTRHPQVDFPAAVERRIEQLPREVTGALNPVSHEDGVLLLLGALAFAVLVVVSSTLLRLLARIRSEGWEVRGP